MTLLDRIDVELEDITVYQQTIARRKTFLLEARTLLRMGGLEVIVLAQLQAKGIVLKEAAHA